MLEPPPTSPEGLITFASQANPRQFPCPQWESLARHRVEYLTYEGPVSRGRGTVQRVARGLVDWIRVEPDALLFDLKEMEFLTPPSAGWPTGQYCLTRQAAEWGTEEVPTPTSTHDPSPVWRLSRLKETP